MPPVQYEAFSKRRHLTNILLQSSGGKNLVKTPNTGERSLYCLFEFTFAFVWGSKRWYQWHKMKYGCSNNLETIWSWIFNLNVLIICIFIISGTMCWFRDMWHFDKLTVQKFCCCCILVFARSFSWRFIEYALCIYVPNIWDRWCY